MAARTFYLETSVWGSLAPRQPRDRKQVVHRLLRLLDGVRGVCTISRAVLVEVEAAPPEYRDAILAEIKSLKPDVLPITDDVQALAAAYLEAGVLPPRRETDALHVAIATCFQLDYLVSWNHRHMTRPMKRLQFESVNRLQGYVKTPLICNPFEACDELRH
jgi:predicted nucleic acid-binding protein